MNKPDPFGLGRLANLISEANGRPPAVPMQTQPGQPATVTRLPVATPESKPKKRPYRRRPRPSAPAEPIRVIAEKREDAHASQKPAKERNVYEPKVKTQEAAQLVNGLLAAVALAQPKEVRMAWRPQREDCEAIGDPLARVLNRLSPKARRTMRGLSDPLSVAGGIAAMIWRIREREEQTLRRIAEAEAQRSRPRW